MSWQQQAACKGRPVDAFFSHNAAKWVRVLCQDCPVATDCLLDALDNDDEGYRAGTTRMDRDRMRLRAPYRTRRKAS